MATAKKDPENKEVTADNVECISTASKSGTKEKPETPPDAELSTATDMEAETNSAVVADILEEESHTQAESETEPVSETPEQPVTDHFWRGVVNGVGLAVLIGAIPIIFGFQLSMNQNASLHAAKIELAQQEIAFLEKESSAFEERLVNLSANETAITALIAEKQAELKTIEQEKALVIEKVKANQVQIQTLNTRMDLIDSQAEKPFFTENLPALPTLKQ